MNEYHYDQVYPYTAILQEVKELMMPTIVDKVNPDDVSETGLSPENLADVIYSHIMALGYNESNIDAAVNDLMPSRNSLLYAHQNPTDAAVAIAVNLAAITEDFKHHVWAFQNFHRDTQTLKPHNEVIINVKRQLLAAEL